MIEFIKNKKIILILIMLFGFFGMAGNSLAAVDLSSGHWETTFDCPEWSGPQSSGEICPGIIRWGDYDANGLYDQITTDANYPGGLGGNGMRQWVIGTGNAAQQAPASEGKLIVFDTPQYEVWVRFYVRYEDGFHFHPNDIGGEKLLYFKTTGFSNLLYSLIGIGSSHVFQYGSTTGGSVKYGAVGFDQYFGPISDGSWHYIEVHIKSETVMEAPFDGEFEMWCDGDLVLENSNVDMGIFSKGKPIVGFMPQHNFHGLPDFGAKYVDFDDITVYNTTPPNTDAQGNPFIGPIGWGGSDTIAPSHPTELSVS